MILLPSYKPTELFQSHSLLSTDKRNIWQKRTTDTSQQTNKLQSTTVQDRDSPAQKPLTASL